MSMKNSNDTIGTRSRDLPVCSEVPHPLCYHVPPENTMYWHNIQHTVFFYLFLLVALSFMRFLDSPQRHNTVGRTPLDEWSARLRHPYLTTHNNPKRMTVMPPARFEPTISADERPQTNALDRAATGTGILFCLFLHKSRPSDWADDITSQFRARYYRLYSLYKTDIKLVYHGENHDSSLGSNGLSEM
jgi:hypothetical protein